MKNKDMKSITLENGKEVEIEKDFYLSQLVQVIEQSEGIYSCTAHKTVVIGTLLMLFFKFNLTGFINDMEVSKADYKKWFEKLAIENDVDKFLYYKLFGGDKEDRRY